jgi:hypothetical protein
MAKLKRPRGWLTETIFSASRARSDREMEAAREESIKVTQKVEIQEDGHAFLFDRRTYQYNQSMNAAIKNN